MELNEQQIRERVNFFIEKEGLSTEEAEAKVHDLLENAEAICKRPPGFTNSEARSVAKTYMKEERGRGLSHVTAKSVHERFFELGLTTSKCANAVGDLLGRKGFGLEPEMKGSKRCYRIPDPEQFSDWYAKDIPLPLSYYSTAFLEHLLKIETINPRSKFFVKHQNAGTTSN
jgi:hypothetical protein